MHAERINTYEIINYEGNLSVDAKVVKPADPQALGVYVLDFSLP